MKRFICNISVLVVIAVCTLFLVNNYLWNYTSDQFRFDAYEDEFLKKKHEILFSNLKINETDRLFFGTSKFYRHINPILLDSLIGDGNKSFNFGHAGLFPFRLFNYSALVLNEVPKDFHGEIYIELTVPQQINRLNFNTHEIQNSLNYKSYLIYLKDKTFLGASTIYSSFYVNRFVILSILNKYTLSGALNISPNYEEIRFNGNFIKKHRGYYPLEMDKNTGVIVQRKRYLNGASIINLDYDFNYLIDIDESLYIKYLEHWISNLKFSHDRFKFIITPRQSIRNFSYLKSIEKELLMKGYKVINLADTEKFPELYEHKYSFDRGHLNREGNIYFNKYLSREILED